MPLTIRLATASLGIVLCSAPGAGAQQPAYADEAPPDWMRSIRLSDSSAPVRPADGARVEQNPPDFSWPDLSRDAQYQLTLTYPDGRTRSRPAPQNWLNWDEILPAGSYSWQVQVTNASGSRTSPARRFTVEANARPFLVPGASTLYERAAGAARPRALPDATTLRKMLDQRQAGLSSLITQVNGLLGAAPRLEPTARSKKEYWAEVHDEARRTLNAAFAWVATKKEEYFIDALRRALNLASWDPRGATSYANADEAAREIAWTLALAYDWLFPRLDATHKRRLLVPLRVRIGDMYNDIIGRRARVAIHPYDSHGSHTLTYLAAMSVVLAGEVPEAAAWLHDTLPLALHWTSPWGGEDGGFANGTAYAHWVTGGSLISWNILRWTVGVDIAQKAWVRNYARYIAYLLPPGTPVGAFGDGAELALRENWARIGKAYTLFAPSALGRWYASQFTGEDITRLELLLTPLTDAAPAPYPQATPNAALFSSIGWAAMHSSLRDPARVSVYFKSSPYGSYNHSHADQNSFVINAGGKPLAIDSGYYDGYKTPHWWQWYKQTRAHNAITFDGGQGQVVFEENSELGPGVITRFEHQSGHDIVTGDATPAYGGVLKEARRSLVYLHPNRIVVYDKLAADTPRQWEWNIHALNRMEMAGDRRITIRNGDQSLCVEMLAGPAAGFTQNDRFSAEPRGQNMPRQWHGAFVSKTRSTSAEFVALMRVGCTTEPVTVTRASRGWLLKLADKYVVLEEGHADVRAMPARR